MATEFGRARCRSCGIAVAHQVVYPSVAPCATGFVRTHHHLADQCQGWAGLGFPAGRTGGPLVCLSCGSDRLSLYSVTGKVSETTECGGVCMAATGPTCSCQCGGANHGIGGAA